MSSKRDRQKRRERARGRQKRSQEDRDSRRTKRMYLNLSKLKGDVNWFKTKKRNLINVVPFLVTNEEYKNLRTPAGKRIGVKPGDTDYKLELPIHRDMGPEGISFCCPNEALGLPCFPCEQKQGLSWPEDRDEIKALNTSWRNLYNIQDHNGEDEELVILWEVSYELFEKEMLDEIEEIESEEDKEVTIGTLEEACSVKFRGVDKTIPAPRGGTGTISFHEYKSFDFPQREDFKDDMLEEAFALDTIYVIPTYEQTKAWFLGMVPDDENGEPEEPAKSEKDDTPPTEEKEPEKEEKTEPEAQGWDDLDDMDHDEMMAFMKAQELRIRGAKRMKEKVLRKALKEERPTKESTEEGAEEKAKVEPGTCPAGHKYGYDCDETADCDDCPIWQECAAEQDKLRADGKIKDD